MKRPASSERNLERIAAWRAACPGITLRSTFIVGFPGETEGDFARLREFVKAAQFDHVGVFAYSHEEGTSAHDLEDRIPTRVKGVRQRELMALQRSLSLRQNRGRVGERVEVLVEGVHPDSDLLLRGRLATQAPEIDGQVIINDGTAAPGSFVPCEISEAHPYDLVARILPS
jgi:ribosomal protein S12 methylthiotransferase